MSINIERSAKRVGVDNRISIRYYYRIADNLIRQANIYRAERNIIDLYVMLLRFSSLITETIPYHRDYRLSPQSERDHFKLKLLSALAELETLKPDVQRQLAELNRKHAKLADGWAQLPQNDFNDPYVWPPVNKPAPLLQQNVQSCMDFDLNAALTSINEVDIPYSVPPIPDLVQPSESNEGEVLEYTDANDHDIIHPALGMELGSADEATKKTERRGSEQSVVHDRNRPVLANECKAMIAIKDAALVNRWIITKGNRIAGANGYAQRTDQQPLVCRSSFNIPPAKDETLMRHSILGPNGLHGQWQPPAVHQPIQYPTSNLDLSPIDLTSFLNPIEEEKPTETKKDEATPEHHKTPLEEVLSLQEDIKPSQVDTTLESLVKLEISKDPSKEPMPPPVLLEVLNLPGPTSLDNPVSISQEIPADLQDRLVKAQAPLQLVISTALMDSFMRIAKSNTNKGLETCGVLAGSLKNRKFFVTALIIPKQEATSDMCNTTNEEEVFEYQDKNSLFSLGWIHTHPTQSCFMSSIDIHTQYSYQVMLPEAIAIVMAPRDSTRNHGIFRLTLPGGMSVIKNCPHSGFHPHQSPPDGGPIYTSSTDVYMDPGLRFDVADLR